jgi:hypothetical protein
MCEQIPFSAGDEFDILGLGEDFIDMMQMSQYMDPFALSCQDMGPNMGDSLNNQTAFPLGELHLELDVFNYHNFATSDNSASFLDSCAGLEIVGLDDEPPMFYSTTGQNYDGTGNTTLTNPAQSSLLVDASGLTVSTTNPAEKRKFEDGLSQFIGINDPGPKRKHRKRFAPDRRKEVDQVRKVGACIRCRITKTKVRNNFLRMSCNFAEIILHLV